MSEHIFKLPDLGEGMVESEIGEWFIKVGDKVAEEDVIGSMMTGAVAYAMRASLILRSMSCQKAPKLRWTCSDWPQLLQ